MGQAGDRSSQISVWCPQELHADWFFSPERQKRWADHARSRRHWEWSTKAWPGFRVGILFTPSPMALHQFSFALEIVDYLHPGDEPRTCPQKVAHTAAEEAGSLTSDKPGFGFCPFCSWVSCGFEHTKTATPQYVHCLPTLHQLWEL